MKRRLCSYVLIQAGAQGRGWGRLFQGVFDLFDSPSETLDDVSVLVRFAFLHVQTLPKNLK
jgi:hypothetical protein